MGSRLVQYLAMLFGNLLLLLSGINLCWPSPYLPLLDINNPEPAPMKLTSDEAFWCSVMPFLGATPGALIAALLVDRIGRKYLLMTLSPICFICFVTIGFTTHIVILDLARFFLGFVEGVVYTVLPMYLGEIADADIRGALTSSMLVASTLGALCVNFAGSYISIFSSSMIFCVIPLLHFATFMWMPRSPYYMIKKGHIKEARKSLRRLRGLVDIDDEFSEISAAVKRQEAVTNERRVKYSDLFTQPGNCKAVLIFLVVCLSSKFSGINPILFYAHSIFNDTKGFLTPEHSAMALHIISIPSIIVGMVAVDKFGRRPMILISSVGCTLTLGILSAYLTILHLNLEIAKTLNWVPVVSLMAFYCTFNIGLCMGPIIMISELFPTSVKGFACGSGDIVSVSGGIIVSKIFHGMDKAFGIYVPFWLFTGCSSVGLILIYYILPETKGKTLDQIQYELTGERIGDRDKLQNLEH